MRLLGFVVFDYALLFLHKPGTGVSSRPSTPSTPQYGAKTPGEIVTSALRNKPRPVGGLKKNIMMYQQNRREVRRSLQENRQHHRSCLLEELAEDSDKQQLLRPEERDKRVSSSAGQFMITYIILLYTYCSVFMTM